MVLFNYLYIFMRNSLHMKALQLFILMDHTVLWFIFYTVRGLTRDRMLNTKFCTTCLGHLFLCLVTHVDIFAWLIRGSSTVFGFKMASIMVADMMEVI